VGARHASYGGKSVTLTGRGRWRLATVQQQDNVQALQAKLESEQKFVALNDRIHAAKSIDAIFTELEGEILALFDAERMTLYALDAEKKELYSKFLVLDDVREIRVPISEKSISGFCAMYRQVINIADAYDKGELARVAPSLHFDSSWDKKTGFRTTQILAVPITLEAKTLGVIQLLNKKHGIQFTKQDEEHVTRIAKTLGIAFNNQQQIVAGRRKTKFDYLLTQHRVSQEDINNALAESRRRQVDVESLLIEQFKVPKTEVLTALSQFYGVPTQEFDEKVIPPPDLMKDMKGEYLKRNLWLPLKREDGHVVVLIDNPQDLQKVDSIHQVLKGQKVKFVVGLPKDILMFLGTASGEFASKDSISNILGDLQAEDAPEKSEDAAGMDLDENDSSIIRLANQVITDAYKAHASDIHIEPYGIQRDTVIRYRVDGGCSEYQKIPGAYRRAIVARL